ncbi:MAG TPA: hypothetical protein VLF18_17525 [Tahibacter sp.]|uniref:hypothetical protein n=1 Tax=Tahibacter sp. TaxID=2056211 RepID=UPI002B8F70C6|nr:hypothetical protein [Tahibacter sp.]HSX61991.1 hypothetical protein [Tahibacter sp.]
MSVEQQGCVDLRLAVLAKLQNERGAAQRRAGIAQRACDQFAARLAVESFEQRHGADAHARIGAGEDGTNDARCIERGIGRCDRYAEPGDVGSRTAQSGHDGVGGCAGLQKALDRVDQGRMIRTTSRAQGHDRRQRVDEGRGVARHEQPRDRVGRRLAHLRHPVIGAPDQRRQRADVFAVGEHSHGALARMAAVGLHRLQQVVERMR